MRKFETSYFCMNHDILNHIFILYMHILYISGYCVYDKYFEFLHFSVKAHLLLLTFFLV